MMLVTSAACFVKWSTRGAGHVHHCNQPGVGHPPMHECDCGSLFPVRDYNRAAQAQPIPARTSPPAVPASSAAARPLAPLSDEERAAGRRFYKRLVWSIIVAGTIGFVALQVAASNEKPEPVGCIYYPGDDGIYGTADDTSTSWNKVPCP